MHCFNSTIRSFTSDARWISRGLVSTSTQEEKIAYTQRKRDETLAHWRRQCDTANEYALKNSILVEVHDGTKIQNIKKCSKHLKRVNRNLDEDALR